MSEETNIQQFENVEIPDTFNSIDNTCIATKNNTPFGELTVIVNPNDNNVFFVAKELSELLQYSQTSNMLKRLESAEFRRLTGGVLNEIKNLESILGSIEQLGMNLISEEGFYSVITNSGKPEAKKFRRYVNGVILPTIRKTGSYNTSSIPSTNVSTIVNTVIEAVQQQSHAYLDEKINKLIAYKRIENKLYSYQEMTDLINETYAKPGGYATIQSMKTFLIDIDMIRKNGDVIKHFLENGHIVKNTNPFATKSTNIDDYVNFSKNGIDYIVTKLIDRGYITI